MTDISRRRLLGGSLAGGRKCDRVGKDGHAWR